MVSRNPNFKQLQSSYLFVEIAKRKEVFASNNPNKKLISLGIGDTTEPLPPAVLKGLHEQVDRLGSADTYTGYPEYNGPLPLRELISSVLYHGVVTSEEVFVSDGSKPDLGRLQFLFDNQQTSIAVQDPVYPVYVDSAVISGKSGKLLGGSKNMYENITYMKCTPENHFFPDLTQQQRTDLIYLCSPNNPTGSAATRQQLESLVKFATKNKSIIIFDSAYREFISDPAIPKSIYEIDGAKKVAMETSSFSKLVGFTGVRLGWTVCPKDLKFSCGSPVWNDWARIVGTIFNGPSNLASAGGMAALSPDGLLAMRDLVNYYMSNVAVIRPLLEAAGLAVYGGVHSPYIWLKVPSYVKPAGGGGEGKESLSWAMFQELLDECSLVCTPGAGFGENGEGFVRLSMFAHRENVKEAGTRLQEYLDRHRQKATS
eukprot:GHVS01033113.1.p1 GENE.GHVS01033113.1~~GHVS01033113.1.p1  ORF type:complete len:428 (-),score=43.02 GHVS01033113.1:121-1404(-)